MKDQSEASVFQYSGTSNLEVMAEAKRYNKFLVDEILKYAPAGGALVDFGAGVGTFALAVRERGRNVCCVEPDASQLAMLEKSGLDCFASLQEITHQASYIYSLNVLEHIENDIAALAELAQKLTPGGRLFIYVPAFPVLFGPMDKLVGHVRRYTRGELRRKVTQQGLKVVRCEYIDSLGFAASLIFNLIGRGDGRLDSRTVRFYDRIVFPLSRALDRLCWAALGKNVLLVADKA